MSVSAATTATATKQTINDLYDDLRAGRLSRRRFIETATAAGATAAAATFLANGGNTLAAQATPDASPLASPVAATFTRPDFGTENQTRGQGDQLRIIWWQAPTTLAPHAAGDSASNLVFDPLLT